MQTYSCLFDRNCILQTNIKEGVLPSLKLVDLMDIREQVDVKDTERYRKLLRDNEGFWTIWKDTEQYWKILKDAESY